MGYRWPLFINFHLYKQTLQFSQQICVKNVLSIHILRRDSNPRLLECESPPITARPGLPPIILKTYSTSATVPNPPKPSRARFRNWKFGEFELQGSVWVHRTCKRNKEHYNLFQPNFPPWQQKAITRATWVGSHIAISVTRFGDLLDFEQRFKAYLWQQLFCQNLLHS